MVADALGLAYPGAADLLAELTGVPQTIGGGPRCTIRLDAAGLRPLHCVVTPSEAGVVARRWAPGTQLNGAEFTESSLSVGDLLRIGDIDIQVVALPSSQPAAEPSPAVIQPAEEPALPCEAAQDEPVPAPTFQALPSETPPIEPLEPDESPQAADVPSNADWVDDSVAEVAEAVAQANAKAGATPQATEDPAIPSHLLRPWAPAGGTPASSPRDTAASVVLLNPIEATPAVAQPAIESEGTAEPEQPEQPAENDSSESIAAKSAADEWSIESEVTTADSPVDAAETVDPVMASAWEAEFAGDAAAALGGEPVAEPAAPQTVADSPMPEPVRLQEAVQEAAEEEVEEEVEQLVEVPAAVSSSSESDSETGKVRLTANRERVRRLVLALREHRERLGVLQASLAERDATITSTEAQLAEAFAATEEAAVELTRLAETAARLPIAEEELAEAQRRIVELEEQIAQIESAGHPDVLTDAVDDVVDSESIKAIEPAAIPVDKPPGEILASEALGQSPTQEAACEQADLGLTETPLEPAPVEPAPAQPVVVDSSTPEEVVEDMASPSEAAWGIEQLAEDPGQDAAQLWGSIEDPPATETAQTEAPIEPPQEAALEPDLVEATEEAPEPAELLETEPSVAAIDPTPELSAVSEFAEAEMPAEQPAPLSAFQPKPAADEEPGNSGAPASFIEQYAHMLPEDDEPVEPPAPIVPVVAEEPAEAMATDGEDDDSIDDYMRKLMERVRGGADAPPQVETTTVDKVSEPAQPVAAPARDPEPVPAAVEPMKCLSEMKSSSQSAPKTDLGALRQLANQSARHAIDVAQTKQSREQATLRLTAAAVAMGCGALASITATSPFGIQFVCGLLGLSAGGWFGVRTLRACQSANREEEMAAAVKGRPIL